jgi:hypothetical protein
VAGVVVSVSVDIAGGVVVATVVVATTTEPDVSEVVEEAVALDTLLVAASVLVATV